MDFLTILEARSPKPRCQQVCFLLRPLPLTRRRPPSRCVLCAARICVQISSYKDTSHWIRAHTNELAIRAWWLRWLRVCLQCRRPTFNPWVGKNPWKREWLLTPIFLLREFYGQRSLAGYSPRDCKESNTTKCQTNILPFCIFFFLGMVLITSSCTMLQTSVHSSLGTLSDLIPKIYLLLPLYNR